MFMVTGYHILLLIAIVVTCMYTYDRYDSHCTNVNLLYHGFVRHNHCQKLVERYMGLLGKIFATF